MAVHKTTRSPKSSKCQNSTAKAKGKIQHAAKGMRIQVPLILAKSKTKLAVKCNHIHQLQKEGKKKDKQAYNAKIEIRVFLSTLTQDIRFAIKRQNSINSPLLSLPWDIREQILKLVLGDKHIHIQVPRDQVPEKVSLDDKCRPIGIPNTSLYNPFIRKGYTCYGVCREHDHWCRPPPDIMVPIQQLSEDQKDCLAVMTACHQLNDEANLVFWSTNTFSFNDRDILWGFLVTLNATQKRYITNIHLWLRPAVWIDEEHWRDVIDVTFLEELQHLPKVSLHVQFPIRPCPDCQGGEVARKSSEIWAMYGRFFVREGGRLVLRKELFAPVSWEIGCTHCREVILINDRLGFHYIGDE